VTLPQNAGDTSQDLVVDGSLGTSNVVPIDALAGAA
jgi:hypothetical protein